jgi:hypothetical protein
MDDKEIKDVKQYDPNVNMAGYAHVPIGQKVEQVKNGGEGSGNFGHAGRPGEIGGSGEGGGSTKGNAAREKELRDKTFKLVSQRSDIHPELAAAYLHTAHTAPIDVVKELHDSMSEHKSKYDPNMDNPGTAFVPHGQKTEMVTNPPYVTPELGDAPEEMQKEADRIYKGLRGADGPFHEETPAARESASRVMWTTLEKSWKKGKDGKWVKKEKSE